jgi:hypothetical protein
MGPGAIEKELSKCGNLARSESAKTIEYEEIVNNLLNSLRYFSDSENDLQVEALKRVMPCKPSNPSILGYCHNSDAKRCKPNRDAS